MITKVKAKHIKITSSAIWGMFLTIFSGLAHQETAIAQIIPDNSLGVENSTTRPETIKNIPSDLIEGGASRGSNLFHSFKEFNIKDGRGAYFANPQVIQNIFTRVTGGNASAILGTLGVLGNANLFLINPNGIIFGPNTRLDIRGAFTASTANSLIFDNNFAFSATNPEAPPLLTVNMPIGLRFREKVADINSTSNLATPGNLTLQAGNLNLSGSITAGGDLNLEALNTLTIRDSIVSPFIAAVGGNLLLQGNQGVDIYVLNHPASGIIAGKDLILRSANAVSGDANFSSGGNFKIETLDKSLGSLVSLYDPVIRSGGNVLMDSYTGTSLHILAGGVVVIPGTIQITGVDTTGTSLVETVTLSDGTKISINGSLEPTLDIRAGTLAAGSPVNNTETPTSADIYIGAISTEVVGGKGGQVFITNQYQPNTVLQSLLGGISLRTISSNGGIVTIDARDNLNLTGTVDVSSKEAKAGNVKLLAQGNISSSSSIRAVGLFGGNVTVESSRGDIVLNNGLEINVKGGDEGNIAIKAQNVSLLGFSKLRAGIELGLGTVDTQAGNIEIKAIGTVNISDKSSISNVVSSQTRGNGGNINITAGSLYLNNGAEIDSSTFGKGNAGKIKITATDSISLSNSNVFSQVKSNAEGNSSGMEITTGSLSLSNGGQISASTSGKGNAGLIKITANDTISLSNSDIFSQVLSGAEGNSGGIEITTGSLSLKERAEVNSSTSGKGNAGLIKITANDSISVTGGIFSRILYGAEGNSGGIEITTGSLSLKEGAEVNSSTSGKGNAGLIKITANDSISVTGGGIFSQVFLFEAEGNSGGIEITTGSLSLKEGAEVNSSTSGKGNAGLIKITANDSISLKGNYISNIQSQVLSGAEGNSGGIEITTGSLSLNDGTFIVTSTFAKGNAGLIKIMASDSISLSGDGGIGSEVLYGAEGNSGGIEITTGSLSLRDGTQVTTSTLGKGNASLIKITATDKVEISGTYFNQILNRELGGILSSTLTTGNAGNIIINTPIFNISNGAEVSAFTTGTGNAGSITINSPQIVDIGQGSKINVETSSAGRPGNINITSDTINIGKDAQLSATATATATNLQGGGSITLNASNLNIAGQLGIFAETQGESPAGTLTLNPDNSKPNLNIRFIDQGKISASTSASGKGGDINLSSSDTIEIRGIGTIAVETTGSGNAGTINFNTNQLTLAEGVRVTASSIGTGNAGNINLNATQVNLQQATITAFTNGTGNAGSILVPNAQNIDLNNSTISTEIQAQGIATQPSNINLTSKTINLNNNSNITASTSGRGDAGDITLSNQQLNLNNNSNITARSTGTGNAGSISLPNTKNLNLNQSEISVSTSNKGNAGSISVPTAQTINLDKGQITASTSGQGNTGVINLTGTEKIELLNNSKVSNAVEIGGVGNAEIITLNTPQLRLENSQITSSTAGKGNAGSILVPNAQTIDLNNSTISTAIESTGEATQPSDITLTSNTLNLNNNSNITASTAGTGNAGDITLSNQQLNLNNNSNITAKSTGTGNAGSISLPNTLNLNLNQSEISVSTSNKGNAGSINVPTAQTINLDKGQITASTSGQGNTGVINLTGTEKIELLNNSKVSNAVEIGGVGNAEIITLNTPQLRLENSQITSSTAGKGNAGSILVPNAQTIDLNNSTISTAIVEQGIATQPSNINLTSNILNLNNNSNITASTSGRGDAGDITLTAKTLNANNQSNIQTNTSSSGQAGDITLNIKDKLNLNNSTIAASTAVNSTGKGGNITINPTNTVNLDQQARISVNSQGEGDGGDIFLTAQNLNLNNGSEISATTASGEGGNITLNVSEIIRQRNNSPISATAGGTGNGGNITVNTKFLIGSQNSDLTANAFEGIGGNIRITAQAIFQDNESEITASSQLGIDGVVETNTPEVDPSQGLVNLPQNVLDPNALISRNACRQGNQSEFTIRGRGGLPASPKQVRGNDEVEVALVELTEQESSALVNPPFKTTRKIIPAQGWQRNEKGEIVLVAYPTANTASRQVVSPITCSSK